MKRLLLFSSLLLCSVLESESSKAQLSAFVGTSVHVTGPGVTGAKEFTISNDGSGTSNQWGGAITTPYNNIPIVKAKDSLACTTLTNTTLAGSFALIYRGDCEFGQKAFQAQQKGAMGVIIVNNIAGGPVGMGAGASGGSVTIPVIMISKTDGDAINAQLNASQSVTISITDWGFGFANDLALVNLSTPNPHALAMPLSQLGADNGSPSAYNVFTGGIVANVGTSNQSNVKLVSTVNFTPTGGSASQVRKDSLVLPTFNAIDSVDIMGSTAGYQLNATQTGKFDFNYVLSADAADQQTSNNTVTATMYVTDSIFSKGRFDIVNGRPIATNGLRPSPATYQVWGSLFYVAKGGYRAGKVQYTVAADGSSLSGQTNNVFLFKWTDGVVTADKILQAGELQLLGYGAKQYGATDSSFDIFSIDIDGFNSPYKPKVEDNSWYWVAVEVADNQFMGLDGSCNYWTRAVLSENATTPVVESWAPQHPGNLIDIYSTATGSAPDPSFEIRSIPFYNTWDVDSTSFVRVKGYVPALALHLSKNVVVGVGEVRTSIGDMNVFPNPASNMVQVDVKLKKAAKQMFVTIADAMGKTLQRRSVQNFEQGKLSFPLEGYAAGQYYLILSTESGTEARGFIVNPE